MTLTRKLTLLAVEVVAVMAISAGAASATAHIVTRESTGATCSLVSSVSHGTGTGGCVMHAVNVGAIEFGTPVGMITCNTAELAGRMGGGGTFTVPSGFFHTITLSGCSSSVVECNEAGVDDNWPLVWSIEAAMNLTFCVTAFGFLNVVCTIPLFITDPASHSGATIETGISHVSCAQGLSNSLQGTWSLENDASYPEIEAID